ncbi:MAG: glycosyltransferase family 9 protein [Deferribacteraceae bacterium]|jgi:heptosyltransferase-2|nr:glycosyltransferase family 9 protein [Deferribacteraceae bacterium]
MKKILIIKIGAMGDIALASSVLIPLKQLYPDSRITWLCGDDLKELVENFPEVDNIITVSRRLVSGTIFHKIIFTLFCWFRLSFSRYDLCLIAHNGKRYKILPILISAKRFRLYSGRSGSIPGRYRGTDYARLADGSDCKNNLPPQFPKIKFGTTAYPRSVLLFPGGAYYEAPFDGLRRWSVDKYRSLAERLLSDGHRVTLIGGASDKWVERYFAGLNVASAVGKTSINSLLALISESSALVSHDSGPMHLAVLVKTPLVALFGPTWHRDCLPQNGNFTAVYPDIPCYPCYDGKYFAFSCAAKRKKYEDTFEEPSCLADISVNRVLEELRKYIN